MASIKAIAAIALTLMITVPIGVGYMLATEENTYNVWNSDSSVNISEKLANSYSPIYMNYTGTSNNTELENGYMNYVKSGTNETAYPTYSTTTVSVSFTAGTQTDLSAYGYWTFVAPSNIKVTRYNDNGNVMQVYGSGDTVTGNGGTISINKSISVTLTVYTAGSTYANVSYGWHLPSAGGDIWSNNQTNHKLEVIVMLPEDSTVQFRTLLIKNTAGVVTAEYRSPIPTPNDYPVYTLGSYTYLHVSFGNGYDTTVSGLNSWPTMGTTYTKYNSITVPEVTISSDFTTVRFTASDYENTVFRVENAEILSGTYPITNDYTLDMTSLYPESTSFDLRFNSIGIYGDTLTIGSESFDVTSGRIMVDGKTVSLKGAVVSSHFDGIQYVSSINNIEVGTTADPATITFGGKWSLTATASFVSQSTESRVEWAPGEFAFGKEDFAACGLLVAGACLIGLGMTGSRSGIKMGVLLLICGGAGLIYLTIL